MGDICQVLICLVLLHLVLERVALSVLDVEDDELIEKLLGEVVFQEADPDHFQDPKDLESLVVETEQAEW